MMIDLSFFQYYFSLPISLSFCLIIRFSLISHDFLASLSVFLTRKRPVVFFQSSIIHFMLGLSFFLFVCQFFQLHSTNGYSPAKLYGEEYHVWRHRMEKEKAAFYLAALTGLAWWLCFSLLDLSQQISLLRQKYKDDTKVVTHTSSMASLIACVGFITVMAMIFWY